MNWGSEGEMSKCGVDKGELEVAEDVAPRVRLRQP